MEYIEQKPQEIKPHQKRNKIILISVISTLVVAAIAISYYFLISRVFIEYENIDVFTYSYRYDEDGEGVTIDAIKEDNPLPAKFRIPNKLNGRPVVEIADNVFAKNTDIEEIIFPNSLKRIGNYCFDGCTNLAKFNIPESLNSIGTDAFNDTAWLNEQDDGEVTVGHMLYTYKGEMEYNSAVVKSEDSPIASQYNGTIVNLGKYTNMSSGVFKGQSGIVYAEIPDDYTEIQDSTFEDCENLETVELPDKLETIGENAFSYCSSLVNIVIPHTVTYIGDSAFCSTKLSGDISLNDKLTYLGSGAFRECSEITSVNIPEDFESISDNLFENCSSLKTVKFSEKDYTVNSTISTIGESAFKGTAIEEFYIPFNVSSVKKGAFSECKNLTSVFAYNNLTGSKEISHYIDEDEGTSGFETLDSYQGIVKFEAEVFKNSTSFKELVLIDENKNILSARDEVNIPVTVINLGGTNQDAYLFSGTSISTLRLAKDFSNASQEIKDAYQTNNSNKITVLPPSFAEGAPKLSHIDFGGESSTITTINRAAFKGCESLEDVELADSIVTIDTNAFENCTSLKNIKLSKNCAGLTANIFANCASLVSLSVPASYKTIGANAFNGCSSLESIVFEDMTNSITNIASGAFANCSKLTSIAIPASCDSISTNIFENCESLTEVTFDDETPIKSISNAMFKNSGIVKITLPKNITSIGNEAFANSKLEEITLKASSVVSFSTSSFEGVTLKHIYVNEDLLEQYKSDTSWKQYESIIEKIS